MPSPSFISDDFDSSHDLKTVRSKIRRMGGKRAEVAHDNADTDIRKGDWAQLDDYDGNIGQSS